MQRMRDVSGLNDSGLAAFCGVHKTTFSAWKKSGGMSLGCVIAFAEHHEVALDWLLLGSGPRQRHWVADDSASYAANVDASITPRPAAGDTVQHVGRLPRDERLGALVDWLIDWWASATAESRSWLIVEVGELRRKWLLDRIRAQMAQPPPADTDAGEG